MSGGKPGKRRWGIGCQCDQNTYCMHIWKFKKMNKLLKRNPHI